ncbi:MAG: PilZ domain-containing protein [Methylobacter sp.]
MMSFKSNQRREHRSVVTLPVQVHLKNTDGQSVKATTITDNLSQGGAFIQLPYFLGLDSFLFIFIQLSNNLRLAARGYVVRTENKQNGLTGVAICFKNTRLLSVSVV